MPKTPVIVPKAKGLGAGGHSKMANFGMKKSFQTETPRADKKAANKNQEAKPPASMENEEHSDLKKIQEAREKQI